MNLSNPILICDENEEFRILIRDMLTKNGFFHVLEAVNDTEALAVLKDQKGFFVIVESKFITSSLSAALKNQKNFIVFADKNNVDSVILAAKLGVEHVMSFPFHSKKLIEKINSLL